MTVTFLRTPLLWLLMASVRMASFGYLSLGTRYTDETWKTLEAFELFVWTPTADAYIRCHEWRIR